MITITIDEQELVEILTERVRFWTNDEITINLYNEMYEDRVYNAAIEVNNGISCIVDNDYVNYCNTVDKKDNESDYNKLLDAYNDDKYDVSCIQFDNIDASYIEAYDKYNEVFLTRV